MRWINLFDVILDGFEGVKTCGRLVLFGLCMLVYCKFMIMLCFYLIYHALSLIIGHGYAL
jgi:hypothetical protein